jgi:xanthine dehydrogenase accessory factor
VWLKRPSTGRYNRPCTAGIPGVVVKHWHETAAILDQASRLAAAGVRSAVATVVRISGSAYRRPGAKFLAAEDGTTAGGVSGGCLESDVRATALEVVREGAPRLLHYDTGADEETVWGMGLGCEGAVDVFVAPTAGALLSDTARRVRDLMAEGLPFAICTPVDGPHAGSTLVLGAGTWSGTTGSRELDAACADHVPARLEDGKSGLERIAGQSMFVDILRPPPTLFLFGAGDDARPLATVAAEAGFSVTIVDHRRAYLTPERFPGRARLVLRRPEDGVQDLGLDRQSFVVIQMHALQHDREWMRAVENEPVAYVGLLGPSARKEHILQQLGTHGGERLFAPVGLDLGADGPEQVAISIVAEMLAVHAGRRPEHLRDKRGGIHDG